MEDEDDEDGFFVPHGYLSDGEGEQDDGDTTGQPKVVIFTILTLLTYCLGRKTKRKKLR